MRFQKHLTQLTIYNEQKDPNKMVRNMSNFIIVSFQVQDVLGRSYGMPEIDEDELEGQLDALLDDMALVSTFKIFNIIIN